MSVMNLFTLRISFISILLVVNLTIQGQRTFRTEGVAQIRVERNMTREEAQQKVVELAKVNAIENQFGTYVEQKTDLTVNSGISDFYIIGTTKVKGVWVKETGREFTEEYRDEPGRFGIEKILWITCRIKGVVKPALPRPAIEFQVRNCSFPACRTTSFLSGEQMYLWYKSPVKGYLSVFIDDGDKVYRLLPYMGMNDQNSFRVNGDENYLFFSKETHPGLSQEEKPDEIELFTLQKKEYNTLYLVFSTHPFFKPGLNNEEIEPDRYILPKSLVKERFQEWLSDNRAFDDYFQDIQVSLEIFSGE